MLVAAAVCPCPPLLVPEVAAGAAAELAELRAACADAIGVLAAARPDRLVVVGPAGQPGRGSHPQGATGSFAGFGVDLTVRLGPAEPDGGPAADRTRGPAGNAAVEPGPGSGGPDQGQAAPVRVLPPSLAVAAWLLERTRWAAAPVAGLGVGEPLPAERCLRAGRDLAARTARLALLVMGDGSACRTRGAPGYLDPRAEEFDARAARALEAADPAALAALDEDLGYALMASGRAPWQVLAGAGEEAGLVGRLRYANAPYGVGYYVATWA
jgi:hypothetical protein